MAEATKPAKKTAAQKKAAATRKTAAKTVAKKAAVPEAPSPAVETSAPAGDDNPTPSPEVVKSSLRKAEADAENWVSTNNGVRFGKL